MHCRCCSYTTMATGWATCLGCLEWSCWLKVKVVDKEMLAMTSARCCERAHPNVHFCRPQKERLQREPMPPSPLTEPRSGSRECFEGVGSLTQQGPAGPGVALRPLRAPCSAQASSVAALHSK